MRPNGTEPFTQVPNVILDDVMPHLRGAELYVLLAIIRQTLGYQRREYGLKFDDLEQLSGMSRPSVAKAVSQLLERGVIKFETKNGLRHYQICTEIDMEKVKKLNRPNSKETLPQIVKKLNCGSKETLPDPVKKVNRLPRVLKKEKEIYIHSTNGSGSYLSPDEFDLDLSKVPDDEFAAQCRQAFADTISDLQPQRRDPGQVYPVDWLAYGGAEPDGDGALIGILVTEATRLQWIKRQMGKQIRDTLRLILGKPVRVEFGEE